MALDEGAVLVQVSRELFLHFISAKPRTLQLYLHKVTDTLTSFPQQDCHLTTTILWPVRTLCSAVLNIKGPSALLLSILSAFSAGNWAAVEGSALCAERLSERHARGGVLQQAL